MVVVVAAVLFPVFAKARDGRTPEEKRRRAAIENLARREADRLTRQAWEEEARGDWRAATRTLRKLRSGRAGSYANVDHHLENLLIRHGQWIAAAKTLASSRHTDSWDTLRQFDLYVAADRRDLATAWAKGKGRTETDLARRAILQAESWKNRWLVKKYRTRLAQAPLKPDVARITLTKTALLAALALQREYLIEREARVTRAHARLTSRKTP